MMNDLVELAGLLAIGMVVVVLMSLFVGLAMLLVGVMLIVVAPVVIIVIVFSEWNSLSWGDLTVALLTASVSPAIR